MIVIVAIVVIGPKDMPLAMRTAGRWIGKMRKISAHFRSGIDAMVREAELEDMERKWREQNEAIMNAAPKLPTADEMQPPKKAKTDAEKANNVEAGQNVEAGPGDEPAALPAPEIPVADAPLAEPVSQPVSGQAEFNLAPDSDPARSAS